MRVSYYRSRIFSSSRRIFPRRSKSARSVVAVFAPVESTLFEVSGFCHFRDRALARRFYSGLQHLMEDFKGRDDSYFESSFKQV